MTTRSPQTPSIEKEWWQSTTLRGAIIAFIGAGLGMLNAAGFSWASDALGDQLEVAITSVLDIVGIAMVVIGRVNATQPIKMPTVPPSGPAVA